MSTEILTTIRKLIADVCDLSPDAIQPAGKLIGYGLDSVRSLDLLLGIEEAFGVEISQQDPELMKIRTVQDLAAFVDARRGG